MYGYHTPRSTSTDSRVVSRFSRLLASKLSWKLIAANSTSAPNTYTRHNINIQSLYFVYVTRGREFRTAAVKVIMVRTCWKNNVLLGHNKMESIILASYAYLLDWDQLNLWNFSKSEEMERQRPLWVMVFNLIRFWYFICEVIFHKRGQVIQTRENWWKHEAEAISTKTERPRKHSFQYCFLLFH